MCFPTETFAWRVVEAVADHLDVVIAHRADVTLARKPASGASISVLDSPFLSR